MNKLNYEWTLKDANFTKDKGKVFCCFACGGGSTMGYKLAGFDVIGHNDIDKRMIEVYKANHNPKYSFLESITTFAKRKDLPKELYNLDILDGSPPCSSFSMAGNRDKDWGKDKKFREGQAEQVLDTLFFDFINLAKELQPKVVIAENVKGLLMGKAKEYVKEIYRQFEAAGYYCQHWLLDASEMGVPQRRKRVFFVCLRKDLAKPFLYFKDMFTETPKLILKFYDKKILFKDVYTNYKDRGLSERMSYVWSKRKIGDLDFSCILDRIENRPNSYFAYNLIYSDKVPNTLIANDLNVLFDECRHFNKTETCKIGSFPLDYNFLSNKPYYLVGMSVPPLMTAKIAEQVYSQWLSKIN